MAGHGAIFNEGLKVIAGCIEFILPPTVIGLGDLSNFLFHPEAMKQTENLIAFMHLFCFEFLLSEC